MINFSSRSPSLFAQIVLISLLALNLTSQPQTFGAEMSIKLEEGIPDVFLDRVLPIRLGNASGTCFVVDVDNRQYLITARHVISQTPFDGKLEIFSKGSWHSIKAHLILPRNEETDVAALAPENIIMSKVEFPLGAAGVVLGQKVYFLGYPFGLASRSRQRDDFIPFVKAGILSAIDGRDKSGIVVYVDGHNNPGFSGGPVIFSNLNHGNTLQIASVISGYRNQPSQVFEKEIPVTDQPTPESKTQKLQFVQENSGIVISFSLDPLLEAIKERPIGPLHPLSNK